MPFSTNETLLVFRIAGIPFAVPAQSVGSIVMPPDHVTHTPGSHRSTPGIFHHAQATYAVIDLHERFGSDTPLKGGGRMLLHEEGIRHFAFLVDEVVGLTRSEEGKWANLPHYLPRDIFPIGFLLQEEIILCSELTLLRDMHDVEPLRRHAEQLKQQAARTTENIHTEKRLEEPANTPTTAPVQESQPTEKTVEKIVTETEQKEPSAPTPQTTPTTRMEAPKPTTTTASQIKRDSVFGTSNEERPSLTTHSTKPPVAKRTAEVRQPARYETTSPQRQPVATTTSRSLTSGVQSATAGAERAIAKPTQPAAHAITQTESDNSWLWFLFILLLLVVPLGYWLWPSAQPRPISSPRVMTPNASIDKTIVPQSIESPTAKSETVSEPPLRIERDDDGTINLIIDRQAAAQSPPPASVQTETAAVAETSESGTTETPPPSEERTVAEEATPSTEEITAAVEVSATTNEPEPCDCTHIVVKGDTLWDIAELYTGNAFNYPDLAKRSGIKNPDRIYPGNKVRIIIR